MSSLLTAAEGRLAPCRPSTMSDHPQPGPSIASGETETVCTPAECLDLKEYYLHLSKVYPLSLVGPNESPSSVVELKFVYYPHVKNH